MKWKVIGALQFILIFPFVIRFRLAAYMLEEALVVVFSVAAAAMVGLLAFMLFTLLRDTIRAGLHWLAFRFLGTGGFIVRQPASPSARRPPSARDDSASHGVGSRIHAPGNSA